MAPRENKKDCIPIRMWQWKTLVIQIRTIYISVELYWCSWKEVQWSFIISEIISLTSFWKLLTSNNEQGKEFQSTINVLRCLAVSNRR